MFCGGHGLVYARVLVAIDLISVVIYSRVLITTDVWARGIDVQQVSLVIK